MRLISKILIIILLAFSGSYAFGQSVSTVPDSLHVVRKNDNSVNNSRQRKLSQEKKYKKDKRQDNTPDNQSGNLIDPANRNQIKKVISARPDFTKMRGARPPDIMRPSGPLLPKGIGKPGGMFRPGGH